MSDEIYGHILKKSEILQKLGIFNRKICIL